MEMELIQSLNAEECGRKIYDVRMQTMTLPLSPFLNFRCTSAPATLDVGLCAANADVRVLNVLPPVQNAGEFVRM